jgi:vitamin B12 transporter
MYPRFKPIAAILPLLFASSTQAADLLASLDPLVVTATRQETRASELLSDVTVIEGEQLEQNATENVAELLARQPGIEVTQSGSYGATSSVFLRGTSSGHTLVLLDGMRLGSASLGSMSTWASIPVSQIERIEILRGPASSLYGSDAIGGVIQIFTKQGEGAPHVNAEIGAGSYGTVSTTAGVSGSSERLRYAFSVAHLRSEGFDSTVRDNSSAWSLGPDKDSFENDSFSGSLAFRLAQGHEIGVTTFYSDGESQYDGSSATTDYRNQQAVSSVRAYTRNQLTDAWRSTLSIGHSTDDSKNLQDGVQASLFRTDQDQYSWQNDIASHYGNFLLGLERLEQQVTGTGNFTVDERSINSALLGWNRKFGAHSLQADLRRDDNSQFGGKNTGSLAYGYRFSPAWRINTSYGTAFKAPSFNDLYYPLTWGYQGNPDLQPETSRNREASLHYEANGQHVSLTWFLNRVDNLISWSGVTTPGNIGTARIEGATLAYEGEIAGYLLGASYTNQDPRDVATGHQLARRASNYGTVSLSRNFGPWETRVEVQASDRRFDTDANTTKLSGYALTNLYAAYHLDRAWSLFARFNNIFDRDYRLVSNFATPGANFFAGVRYSPQ